MRTCPNCNQNITDARSYCPRCGAKLNDGIQWKPLAVGLAFLLACAVFFAVAYSPSDERPRPPIRTAATIPLQSPAQTPLRPEATPTRLPERPAPARDPPARGAEEVAEDTSTLEDEEEVTVYVTRTGKKYHRGSCQYLRRSKIPMELSEARKLYDPCSVCDPPE